MISKNVKLAAQLLENNEIIGLPTETVYGLAGNAFSEHAIKSIYRVKNRPSHNPLIVHIKNSAELNKVASEIPELAKVLADKFWPGPLTLLLPKHQNIPNIVTAGSNLVAVRVPNHPMAIELLSSIKFPLVAPSANPFGSISPTSAEHVHNFFKNDIKLILDGGICKRGIESTIIGFQNGTPVLYRYGSIALEEIEKIIGKVTIFNKNDVNPDAPGMLSRHYAPSTKLLLTNNVRSCLAQFPDKKIGLLLFKEEIDHPQVKHQIMLSKSGDMKEAAANLYQALHQLDNIDIELIIAEKFPMNGLGNTINDRLARATKNK